MDPSSACHHTPFEVGPDGCLPDLCSVPCGNDSSGQNTVPHPTLPPNPSQDAGYTQKRKGFKGIFGSVWIGMNLKSSKTLARKNRGFFQFSRFGLFHAFLKVKFNGDINFPLWCTMFPHETIYWGRVLHWEGLDEEWPGWALTKIYVIFLLDVALIHCGKCIKYFGTFSDQKAWDLHIIFRLKCHFVLIN